MQTASSLLHQSVIYSRFILNYTMAAYHLVKRPHSDGLLISKKDKYIKFT